MFSLARLFLYTRNNKFCSNIFSIYISGFELSSSQTLCGYIQTSGPKFYASLCPSDKKEDWFKQFSGHDNYKVYT